MSLNPRARRREVGLVRRISRWVAGIALIVVGLVLAVPGIPGPGLLLALFGVLVLLPESRWLQKKYAAMKRRYPRAFGAVERRFRRRSRRRNDGPSRRAA
jgi:UPF0716 family protein affecting phage T7 exclusion